MDMNNKELISDFLHIQQTNYIFVPQASILSFHFEYKYMHYFNFRITFAMFLLTNYMFTNLIVY